MSIIDLNHPQFLAIAREILVSGHSLQFRARGGSMRPLIRDGDLLEIAPLQPNQLSRGDILLYQHSSSQLLVHRLVGIEKTGQQTRLLMQGDAVVHTDGWSTSEQVLGRVVSIHRANRKISLKQPSQRWLAAALAHLLPPLKNIYSFARPRLRTPN
jgi:signal peptidase I